MTPIRIAAAIAIAGIAAVAAAAEPAAEPVVVRAVHQPEGAAARPDAPAWRDVPETKLSLSEQLIVPPLGGGSVREVAVRAVHDGTWLAIRLAWNDETADRAVGLDTFRDAVAVGFPLGETEPPPSPFMGDEEHPVSIWQWTADFDANEAGRADFSERYPHTEGVWYFPQDAAVRREVRAWRGSDPVVVYTATGFGTLEHRPGGTVYGESRHDGKRWHVVLRRRLSTGQADDAAFKPGERTQLIVAVWDGAKREVNGRKSVTLGWTPLRLEPTVERHGGR